MKLVPWHIFQLLLMVLLIAAGAMAEYRYGLVELTPLSHLVVDQTGISRDVRGSTIKDIVNGQPPADFQTQADMSVFWRTWQMLESQYYLPEKIDPQKMVDGAIAGMVASLGDPYTAYLPPKENERSGQDLAGSFYGVGIELGYSDEGILSVIAPLDDTPAARAGLQPNDYILRVKDAARNIDEDTSGWTVEKAVDNIRGPRGSKVTLTLLRKGPEAQPFEVELERGEIVVKSVKLEFPTVGNKKIAHLRLSKFGERTKDEWDEAVGTILNQRGQIAGIVLDMRNNPGGLFDDAIYIASDFIPSGVVVAQKGKYLSKDYTTQGDHRLRGIPVVVLVNQGSASAAEIVAGALKDRLNVPIVGEKTFGKGTVQDRIALPNDGGLHVTIAQWLTPNGSWIHDVGIPVTVEQKDDPATKDTDEQLIKAAEQL